MQKLFVILLALAGVYQSELTAEAMPTENVQQVNEQTLAIIKPDAVKNQYIGEILARYEDFGFNISGLRMTKLSKDQAGQFYAEHKGRPFYEELVNFMSSGPIVVVVLEGKGAIAKNRQLMGATDPSKAEEGTLRADYGESTGKNAVHGSDSSAAAKREIEFFFKSNELYN